MKLESNCYNGDVKSVIVRKMSIGKSVYFEDES